MTPNGRHVGRAPAAQKRLDKIVLIGYRAAGKSTLARHLAQVSGLAAHSTDVIIARRAGMRLEDLIESKGWPAFREMEVQVVQQLCRQASIIVDCGGGVATSAASMECLAAHGLLVHVHADIDLIRQRLHAAPRPLLAATNVDADIASTYEARHRLYQRWADIRVDTGAAAAAELAENIWRKFTQLRSAYER